jgi:alpha-tubulin suppressor-like RCC1 family protein
MKFARCDNRSALFALRAALIVTIGTLVPLILYGSAPSWWSQRGVLAENATPDDYAPANHGQLKNIAKAAVAEMDAKLEGGAGDELHSSISSWLTPTPQTNDFAPANLGQLKTMAKPFYDRLIALGLVDFYPWLSALNPPDDFAVANIGQLKKLFSFEIPTGNSLDDSLGNRLAAGQHAGNLALEANAVWFWGNRFGVNSSFQSMYPRRVTGLVGVSSVSAGDDHLVALGKNGSVLTWGKNTSGQLGDGTNVDQSTPGVVPNLSNVISVKTGYAHTLVLQRDGTLVAWGDNYYGQLGNGDNIASSTPIRVVNLDDVRKIAAGSGRSVALRNDGTVWSWGYDHYAWQSGLELFSNTPSQIPDLTDVIDIAAGYEHVVVVKADGSVWAWGSNYSNQIANGNPWSVFQIAPVQVPNLADVAKVASNSDHSLALLKDGTVWAWGANNLGQLGDGTTQARQRPVQVTGLSNVVAIATNWSYSMAMKTDGTVWTWGDGSSGTLPGVDLHIPQQVGLGLFDTNHNGMDDRWEMEYFGNLGAPAGSDSDGDGISDLQEFLRGTDPTDYFNGATPAIEIVSGNNQFGDAGTIAAQPLSVRVKVSDGQVARNAPVKFSVTSGAGELLSGEGSRAEEMTVRTGTEGTANVQFAFGELGGISSRVSALAGRSNTTAEVIFRINTKYHPPPIPGPSPAPNASPTPAPSPTATPAAPYRYAIIDLGKDADPVRVNNKGWVLLGATDTSGGWGYYRWKGGAAESLTFEGKSGAAFYPADMNDRGTVVGTLYDTVVDEPAVGLIWRAGESDGKKVSAMSISDERGWYPTMIKRASCSAVTNDDRVFGQMYTGGQFFAFDELFSLHYGYIENSCRWSIDGALAEVISNAHKMTLANGGETWTGRMDSIFRANSTGRYIGHTLAATGAFTNFIAGPVAVCRSTGMLDSQPISFTPVDINEAGIVVGFNNSGMMIHVDGSADTAFQGYPVTINDHVRPADPQPSATSGPSRTPIPAPQVLGWDGNATVLWERQDDGQTWHPFGLEEMIPNMDGWQIRNLSDMNDAGMIVGTGWYTDPLIPHAQTENHAFLLVPVELMVDGNRDGEMSFTDSSVSTSDQTSEDKPYRFWLNDDDDTALKPIEAGGDTQESDSIPPRQPDFQGHQIVSKRNLEDFARFWIDLRGLRTLVAAGQLQLGLRWKNTTASPAINIYSSEDATGSTAYLYDDAIASRQIADVFNNAVTDKNNANTVDATRTFVFKDDYWNNLSEINEKKCFLFEGTGAGKGQLCVVFFDREGKEIGEGGSVWLELKDIKKMYERGIATPQPLVPSSFTGPPSAPVMGSSIENGSGNFAFEPASDQTLNYLIFVHGWNQDYDRSSNYAETLFKRLWQRGYKGRFAAFRWPTYYSNVRVDPSGALNAGLARYNDSEYVAWNSGNALRTFSDSLPGNGTRSIAAHSMGNIVVGAALRAGLTLDGYAILHGATSASCYSNDRSPYPPDVSHAFASSESDSGVFTKTLLYRGFLGDVPARPINFYDENDSAVTLAWNANSHFFKPQLYNAGLSGYGYRSDLPDGSRLYLTFLSGFGPASGRGVTNPSEAKAYVDFSLTGAIGGYSAVRGSIIGATNDNRFGDDHGAEWNQNIQQLSQFFDDLVHQLDL